MNRRHFFHQLASGLIATSAPSLFLPKLIKPAWRLLPKYQFCNLRTYELNNQIWLSRASWINCFGVPYGMSLGDRNHNDHQTHRHA